MIFGVWRHRWRRNGGDNFPRISNLLSCWTMSGSASPEYKGTLAASETFAGTGITRACLSPAAIQVARVAWHGAATCDDERGQAEEQSAELEGPQRHCRFATRNGDMNPNGDGEDAFTSSSVPADADLM